VIHFDNTDDAMVEPHGEEAGPEREGPAIAISTAVARAATKSESHPAMNAGAYGDLKTW